VVLLPAHPNIVPTARQAARLGLDASARGLRLHAALAVDSVPRALTVLTCVSHDALDLEAVEQIALGVRAGEVVAAVRDATTPIGPVKAGQFLAVVDGDVASAHDSPADAMGDVLRGLEAAAAELVTLISGAEVAHDEVRLVTALAARITSAECVVVAGGQQPVRWLVGVE
jgi:hypothetical protein